MEYTHTANRIINYLSNMEYYSMYTSCSMFIFACAPFLAMPYPLLSIVSIQHPDLPLHNYLDSLFTVSSSVKYTYYICFCIDDVVWYKVCVKSLMLKHLLLTCFGRLFFVLFCFVLPISAIYELYVYTQKSPIIIHSIQTKVLTQLSETESKIIQ